MKEENSLATEDAQTTPDPWNDPNVPVGCGPPLPSWPTWVSGLVWVAWLVVLVTIAV